MEEHLVILDLYFYCVDIGEAMRPQMNYVCAHKCRC